MAEKIRRELAPVWRSSGARAAPAKAGLGTVARMSAVRPSLSISCASGADSKATAIAGWLAERLRIEGFDVEPGDSGKPVLVVGRPPTDPSLPSGFADAVYALEPADALTVGGPALVVAASGYVAAEIWRAQPDRPVLVAPPEMPAEWFDVPPDSSATPPSARFVCVADGCDQDRLRSAIEAFAALSDTYAQFVLISDGEPPTLRDAIRSDPRVEVLSTPTPRDLTELFATSSALIVPDRHRPLHLGALHGQRAGAPLIVSNDAGAPTEFVEHGLTGMIVEPTVEGMRWAMQHIAETPLVRWTFSLMGRRRLNAVRWDHLVGCLADLADPVSRPHVTVLSTFGLEPMVGGGQRRIRMLDRELAANADVTVLVSSTQADASHRILEPGLHQIDVPRSPAQREAEDEVYDLLGFPTDDLTSAALAATTPEWAGEIDLHLRTADVVIASHPFLAPTIPASAPPIVYDSHNAETAFKAKVLPDDENGRWLLAETERAERAAVERADTITACTPGDLAAVRSLGARLDVVTDVIPNGVDVDALPRRTAKTAELARVEVLAHVGLESIDARPIVTFIGSWHRPNIEAAELLVAVADERPDWIFVLAGSHSSELAERDTPVPDNVRLIPTFAEGLLWPLIAGATVAANPMRSGGGSNLKILDYLAVGTPVLSTPVGSRGIPDADELLEVVEPTAAALSAALDRLDDPSLADRRRGRSDRGRQIVEDKFAWRVLGKAWTRIVLETAGSKQPPSRRTFGSPAPIVLATSPPPSPDPVTATMQAIGLAAADGHPPFRESTMDPALRESLKQAAKHKNVGRELPDDARMVFPKKAVIRIGQALSNEQLHFNEATLETFDRLVAIIDDLQSEQHALLDRVNEAEAALTATREEINVLRSWRNTVTDAASVSSATAASVTTETATTSTPTAQLTDPLPLDHLYEAFEDELRGSREDVRAFLAPHLERFRLLSPDGVVVDIGSGRGEWLEMLGEIGVTAYGFDTNHAAVARSVERGLDARLGDGIAHLEQLPAASVAGVTSFHVAEHLPFEDLHRLVVAAHRVLEPRGILLLETPNCLNLQVGASSFWLDPTHRQPVHPELLRFLFRHVGFGDIEVFGLRPEEGLTPQDIDPDPARNGLLTEVHRLVFGSADVAIVGQKANA